MATFRRSDLRNTQGQGDISSPWQRCPWRSFSIKRSLLGCFATDLASAVTPRLRTPARHSFGRTRWSGETGRWTRWTIAPLRWPLRCEHTLSCTAKGRHMTRTRLYSKHEARTHTSTSALWLPLAAMPICFHLLRPSSLGAACSAAAGA